MGSGFSRAMRFCYTPPKFNSSSLKSDRIPKFQPNPDVFRGDVKNFGGVFNLEFVVLVICVDQGPIIG